MDRHVALAIQQLNDIITSLNQAKAGKDLITDEQMQMGFVAALSIATEKTSHALGELYGEQGLRGNVRRTSQGSNAGVQAPSGKSAAADDGGHTRSGSDEPMVNGFDGTNDKKYGRELLVVLSSATLMKKYWNMLEHWYLPAVSNNPARCNAPFRVLPKFTDTLVEMTQPR